MEKKGNFLSNFEGLALPCARPYLKKFGVEKKDDVGL